MSAADLVALDKADGTEDGVIDLANVQSGTASYRFVGADAYGQFWLVRFLPPVMWMGMAERPADRSPWADGIGNGENCAGETYLIAAADLVALDKADGTEDGVIDLANVQNGAASYRFVGADAWDYSGLVGLFRR